MGGVHQQTGQALAALATTGIAKGIYRFATHDEMNRHSEEALARAIAANVRQHLADAGLPANKGARQAGAVALAGQGGEGPDA